MIKMAYKILQSTISKILFMELEDSSIDWSFICKRMLQLMCFFFLMFILKEKLINTVWTENKNPYGESTRPQIIAYFYH